MNYIDKIEAMGACKEAVEWLREKNYKSLAVAWRYCDRGDWMMWLVGRGEVTEEMRAAIVLAACDFADLVREHWRPEDKPILAKALKTARKWTEGSVTAEEMRAAARAATDAAANAAARAAEVLARWATQKQCADIARKHLSCPRLKEGE